ncbi:MAG TPA: MlaD family protein, partial [Casimicrobiaceae bacterium]
MKRLAALAFVLAAAVTVAALGCGSSATGGGDTYRVDAIFDNASFLIHGQDVRIAGANVGSVEDVRVTPDNRARIEMKIDKRFAPFRSDADCFIAPQSLIGERFIQCAPGTPRGHVLRSEDGHAPTVPITNTHSPVDPDLVLSTYDLPVRQRLSIILNELGAGLAGDGHQLSAAI